MVRHKLSRADQYAKLQAQRILSRRHRNRPFWTLCKCLARLTAIVELKHLRERADEPDVRELMEILIRLLEDDLRDGQTQFLLRAKDCSAHL